MNDGDIRPAVITANNGGTYDVQIVSPDGLGARWTAAEPSNAGKGVGDLCFVTLLNNQAHVFHANSTPPGTLFRVNLSQTGGSNGNKTTAPTWTYTVNDLDSNELATAQAPEHRPIEFGEVTAATKGMAYYDSNGTLKLAYADEVYEVGDC